MIGSPEPFKLARLRAKTDRQLFDFIDHGLMRGLTLARIAEAFYALRDPEHGVEAQAKAARAYEECGVLLWCVESLGADRKRQLEQRHEELREVLSRLSERRGATANAAA